MPTKTKHTARLTHMFDVVVIGAGSAGIAAMEGARAAGAKSVCLVESESRLGGECAYWACVPTKAMLKAGKLYHQARYGLERYGVYAKNVSFNFDQVLRRREAVVKTLTGHDKRLPHLAKSLHVTVKHGLARFIDTHTLDVDGERVRSKAFVIATGSKERIPEIDGIADTPVWYSRDVVTMERLPKSVAIIGGGPIGSEFATIFGLFGIKTSVLEVGEHILPREDSEISVLAESHLHHLGVHVLTKTKTLGIRREGQRLRVTFQTGRQPRQSMVADKVVMAVGRVPNLEPLTVSEAKLKLSPQGRLEVSKTLQTKQKHILGAGDAVAQYQFTHYAHQQGYMAGWNAAQVTLKGQLYKQSDTVIPRLTFVDPEVASVGLTVVDAAKAKLSFKVVRFPFSALGRAAIDGQRDGLCKIIVEVETNQILGAHVIGERAGEIIHELALAMHAKLPLSTVQSMLHAYPSWSEVIPASNEI